MPGSRWKTFVSPSCGGDGVVGNGVPALPFSRVYRSLMERTCRQSAQMRDCFAGVTGGGVLPSTFTRNRLYGRRTSSGRRRGEEHFGQRRVERGTSRFMAATWLKVTGRRPGKKDGEGRRLRHDCRRGGRGDERGAEIRKAFVPGRRTVRRGAWRRKCGGFVIRGGAGRAAGFPHCFFAEATGRSV